MSDYYNIKTYKEAANYLVKNLPEVFLNGKTQVGIVCGSGLGGLRTLLQDVKEFEYKDIPHFGVSTVQGHAGKLVFGKLGDRNVVCMLGRKHVYEGHPVVKTAFPIRVMKLIGVKVLITTNAAGALNPSFNVGDIMVISDHLSFPGFGGQNPLVGPNIPEFGERFPAVSDAYDFDLRLLAFTSAESIDLDKSMREGVYAYVMGPSYETRAEARFLQKSGGDVVGMSTVPEVLAARHCGIKVLGLSLVTNKVAQSVGKSARDQFNNSRKKVKLNDENVLTNHNEVLENGEKRSAQVQALVKIIVSRLNI